MPDERAGGITTGRGNAWAKVVEGVQHCAPVQHDSPDFAWVVYVDVEEAMR